MEYCKKSVYLSLGSNVEPSEFFLRAAITDLSKFMVFEEVSSLYRSAPLEDTNQDDFYNIAARFNGYNGSPEELLIAVQKIEIDIGRVKDPLRPKGPRIIDIDILFFSDNRIDSKHLCIPHKGLLSRRFMLEPLVEIYAGDGYFNLDFLREALKDVTDQQLTVIGEFDFGK